MSTILYEELSYDSFLEYVFLRWVLTPSVRPAIKSRVMPQNEVAITGRAYRVDYAFIGEQLRIAVEQ